MVILTEISIGIDEPPVSSAGIILLAIMIAMTGMKLALSFFGGPSWPPASGVAEELSPEVPAVGAIVASGVV